MTTRTAPITHQPRSLWILLSSEHDRDGYALKPLLWEGPGEYQRFAKGDDLGVLVKVEQNSPSAAARSALKGE